jgi:hypothetical protein
LYRGILLFLVKAKKYLGQNTARRIASNIAKGDEFSSLLADAEKQEQIVRLNADNADAEYMGGSGHWCETSAVICATCSPLYQFPWP